VQDPITDEYWITTRNGLLLFNEKKNQYSYRGNNPDNNPIITQFEKLDYTRRPYFDKQGRFGLGRWIPFQGPPDLYCYTRKKNNIWVGTLGNGIFAYDSMLNPLPDPLRANNRKNYDKMGIWHLAQRKNGDTWVGAQNGNLIVFDSDDHILADITPAILEKKSI